MMKFAVTVISPPGYIHSAAFNEVAETIHYGLLSLGHDSVLTTEGTLPGRQHIVLGSNLLPHYPLPIHHDAILYNLEQVEVGSIWFRPELITYLQLEIFRLEAYLLLGRDKGVIFFNFSGEEDEMSSFTSSACA